MPSPQSCTQAATVWVRQHDRSDALVVPGHRGGELICGRAGAFYGAPRLYTYRAIQSQTNLKSVSPTVSGSSGIHRVPVRSDATTT